MLKNLTKTIAIQSISDSVCNPIPTYLKRKLAQYFYLSVSCMLVYALLAPIQYLAPQTSAYA